METLMRLKGVDQNPLKNMPGQLGLQSNEGAKINQFWENRYFICSYHKNFMAAVASNTAIRFSGQLLSHSSVAFVYLGDTGTTKSKAVYIKLIVKMF